MTTAKALRKLWPITVSSISLPADHPTLLFDAAYGNRGSSEWRADGGNGKDRFRL